MKKSVLLGAGTLAAALLTGCGGNSSGGSSSGGSSATEYDLSSYEGRTVSADTLAGTWVAVGTGTEEFGDSEGSFNTNFAIKEYFVVTESGDGYNKPSCDYPFNYDIEQDGEAITVNDFVGTLTDNKLMVGKIKDSWVDSDGDTWEIETNLTIVKISDETSALANVTANVSGQDVEAELFCYQQSNGFGRGDAGGTKYQVVTTPVLGLMRWEGNYGFTYLYSSIFSFNWDTNEGDSASFEVNVDSSLIETVTFNGTDGSDSATGSIVVQLPVQ